MPVNSQDVLSNVQDALEGYITKDQAQVLAQHITQTLNALGYNGRPGVEAVKELREQMNEWRENLDLGQLEVPSEAAGWCNIFDQGLPALQQRTERAMEKIAQREHGSGEEALKRNTVGEALAKKKDLIAREGHLPQLVGLEGVANAKVVGGYVAENESRAERLRPGECLSTQGIGTCAGFTLFDPATNIGVMVHVKETAKANLQTALQALSDKQVELGMGPEVEKNRLQAVLFPGYTGPENIHTPIIRDELKDAKIKNVRDFSLEGRSGASLTLMHNGNVSQECPLLETPELNANMVIENDPSGAHLESPRSPRLLDTNPEFAKTLGHKPPAPGERQRANSI